MILVKELSATVWASVVRIMVLVPDPPSMESEARAEVVATEMESLPVPAMTVAIPALVALVPRVTELLPLAVQRI